jgi:hypothetical protein
MMRRLISLTLCGAAVLLEPNVATAQGAQKPSTNDPRAEEARRRFREGMRATDAEDFERARLAYLQTYALNQSPEVLRNLGVAEIRTGRLAEGARHLAAYLRGSPATTENADQRRYAADLLRQTEAKIARLSVRVDIVGAEVVVDGESAGRSPLDFEWHVDPGTRLITVRSNEIERTRRVTVRPGDVVQLTFQLAPDSGAASLPPDSPPPVRAGLEPRPAAPPAKRVSSPERAAWPIYVGGGIAVAAAATGAIAALSASSNQEDLERLRARIGPSGCRAPTPHAADCADVARLVDGYDRNVHLARAAFVVFGVTGLATIAYVAWPVSTPSSARNLTIAVGPRGVAVRGLF